MDVRPGGRYRFRTPMGVVEGEFREVDAPERLVQTFQNHLQTLEFEDLGEQTKLTQTMRFCHVRGARHDDAVRRRGGREGAASRGSTHYFSGYRSTREPKEGSAMSTGHTDDVAAGVGRIGERPPAALGEVVERRYEVAAIDFGALPGESQLDSRLAGVTRGDNAVLVGEDDCLHPVAQVELH